MTRDEQIAVLRDGDIEVIGRISASSNQALLVELRLGELEGLACYKAEAGERPLWDFPNGLWRREVAAYALDVVLGTDLVPPTVGRDDGPFGPGSYQWWVDDNESDHYFTLRTRTELHGWLINLAAFDVVANNADRKSGHVVYDGERCWAIDNGLCFHRGDKLRTVVWEFAGCALPENLCEPLAALADGEVGELDRWLSAPEIAATRQRAAELLDAGELPTPDSERDWPPYPWPLI